MIQPAIDYARANCGRFVSEFLELLSIPSISTLPEHRTDVERAAGWVAADLFKAGLRDVQVFSTAGHPVVYGEWTGAGDDAQTVLVYGHYDVQPVDPLELWDSPPFEPQIRSNRVYARGATDDKGQVVIHLKALEAMLKGSGSLPVNVKVLLEGEEETGSLALEAFVREQADRLRADSVLISDSSFLVAGQPAIPYSVRGIAAAEVRVRGPKTDLHSGGYGGTVHNPASALAAIIAALHDSSGRVQIPGFYDRMRPLSEAERDALRQVPYTLGDWQKATGLAKPWGEPEFSLVERFGARPTCEVNGMWSGFQGEGSKTIIPKEAGAKITMRLVPDQNPQEVTRLFVDFIRSIAPDDLTVDILVQDSCWPAITPLDTLEIEAASRAYQDVWGVSPVFTRGGGSIPIVATLQQVLKAPVILMGFGHPDAGVHAPNEWFGVDQFHWGIEAIIRYYSYLAKGHAAAS